MRALPAADGRSRTGVRSLPFVDERLRLERPSGGRIP